MAKRFASAGCDLVVGSGDEALAGAADSLRRTGAEVGAVRDPRTRAGGDELHAAVKATGRPVHTGR